MNKAAVWLATLLLTALAAWAGASLSEAQTPGCGLTTPAFCSTNPADFVVSRVGGYDQPAHSLPFPHNNACGQPTDVAVCGGGIRLATKAENYSVVSLRPKAAFDFAGRTGKITLDGDFESTGPLGSWLSIAVTDDPNPGAGDEGGVAGSKPRNGFILNFNQNGACGTNGSGLDAYSYSNYVQTSLGTTGFGQCQADGVVHMELRVSQPNLEVWSNGALYFSRPLSLNFSRGYIHYQIGQRAPSKYGLPYSNHFVSNLGFDGPQLPEVVTEVPDGGNAGIGWRLPQALSINSAGGSGRLAFTLHWTNPPNNGTVRVALNGGAPQAITTTNIPAALTCPAWSSGGCNWAIAFVAPVSGLLAGSNSIAFSVEGANASYVPLLANVSLISTGGIQSTPTPTSTSLASPPPASPTHTTTPTPAPPVSTSTSTVTPLTATPTPVVLLPTSTPLPTRQCTVRWGSTTVRNLGQMTQAQCTAVGAPP